MGCIRMHHTYCVGVLLVCIHLQTNQLQCLWAQGYWPSIGIK